MKNCFNNPLKSAIIIYIIFIVIYLVFLRRKVENKNKYLFPIIVITLSVLIYYICILFNFYFLS